MIEAEDYLEVKISCDLCGREFDAHDLECQSRTGNYLCSWCIDEEQNCGCADD